MKEQINLYYDNKTKNVWHYIRKGVLGMMLLYCRKGGLSVFAICSIAFTGQQDDPRLNSNLKRFDLKQITKNCFFLNR